jgi:hypothetical protein
LGVLGIALTGICVAQTDYYVATTGSDSNPGTQTRPWRTINHADSAISLGSAGTIVHVAPGTYFESITTKKSGTASARITYVSDTQYGAKLVGAGPGLIWRNWAAYIDVVGFEFDGSVSNNTGGGYANEIPEASHTQFLRNKVHHIDNPGGIHNCCDAVGDFYHGTAPQQALANTFEQNLLYHNNGGAGTGQTSYGDSAGGMVVGWGDIVRNNIIMDQGGGWCVQISHTSTNVIFTNNTLFNCDRGGVILASPSLYQGGINDYTTVTNNIIANNGAAPNNAGTGGLDIYTSGGCGPHDVLQNNLMYGNVPGNVVNNSGCPNIPTGTQTGSNSTTFVNYTGTISGDYHLKAGSTAVGKGTTSCASSLLACAPSVDFSGNTRSLTSLDISAFKFGSTLAGPLPPSGLMTAVSSSAR